MKMQVVALGGAQNPVKMQVWGGLGLSFEMAGFWNHPPLGPRKNAGFGGLGTLKPRKNAVLGDFPCPKHRKNAVFAIPEARAHQKHRLICAPCQPSHLALPTSLLPTQASPSHKGPAASAPAGPINSQLFAATVSLLCLSNFLLGEHF
jgi:hypothetical protein